MSRPTSLPQQSATLFLLLAFLLCSSLLVCQVEAQCTGYMDVDCLRCPAGTVMSSAADYSCSSSCSAGQSTPPSNVVSTSSTSCSSCSVGFFSSSAGSWCIKCPPGQYPNTGRSTAGASSCSSTCPGGYTCADPSSITQCVAGTYAAPSKKNNHRT
eukprot:gnl/Hemi2/19652_TR6526_c0_g1_i1.p1 gnl/Hemi2/19652_TR6526_c0_g1~~gnl/Hemi2/19652_TR6526_c0_g1_i1.p1  ORF type:complete len:156 (-),score=18.85 gnl/Hemi2/19652_TR6526_c0_g1_i1:396-863(-)